MPYPINPDNDPLGFYTELNSIPVSEELVLLDDDAPVFKAYDMNTYFADTGKHYSTDRALPFELVNNEGLLPSMSHEQAAGNSEQLLHDIHVNLEAETIVNNSALPSTPASDDTAETSKADDGDNQYDKSNTKIVAIGVDKMGCNTLNYLAKTGKKPLQTIAVDSQTRRLEQTIADHHIQLGNQGLSCARDASKARKYAEEREADIRALLEDVDMVFITTDLGRGVGSGATPVIAQIAHDMDILVASIVYMPQTYMQHGELAAQALEDLTTATNALMVVPLDNLAQLDEQPSGEQFLDPAYQFFADAINSIQNIIADDDINNLDINDLKEICQYPGRAFIGTGTSTGNSNERVEDALKNALNNPLAETPPQNAQTVLLHLTGSDFTNAEIEQACTTAQELLSTNRVDCSPIYKPNLTGELHITIIATGINHHEFGNQLTPKNTPSTAARRRQQLPMQQAHSNNISHIEHKRKKLEKPIAEQHAPVKEVNGEVFMSSISPFYDKMLD